MRSLDQAAHSQKEKQFSYILLQISPEKAVHDQVLLHRLINKTTICRMHACIQKPYWEDCIIGESELMLIQITSRDFCDSLIFTVNFDFLISLINIRSSLSCRKINPFVTYS